MTPRDLGNILTSGNSCRDTLPSATRHYQAAQRNHKTPISVSSTCQVRPEKVKKGQASTLTTATTNVHLPKPVSFNLTIKSELVLTNPIGKDGVRGWSI